MSINFSTLQGLTISEGNVTQITDASGRVLWSAVKKATITLVNYAQYNHGKIYYNGVQQTATFTANIGDTIEIQGVDVAINNPNATPSRTPYQMLNERTSYTVVSDATFEGKSKFSGSSSTGMYYLLSIAEEPITFTINGTEYSAYPSMTWTQWNDSEFNTSGQKVATVTDASGNSVSLDSLIVGGTAYEVGFVTLIEFNVDNIICFAEQGMTWFEWRNSTYYNSEIGLPELNGWDDELLTNYIWNIKLNGNYAYSLDKIIAGGKYVRSFENNPYD